ncbi:uncharacterized protein [Palaemon carinicauda]|uniref:uncharacterized protein isoform X1 n=2 Tax=Palaemon carinicauda TaxID=392227 RepID=UPI0035B69F29
MVSVIDRKDKLGLMTGDMTDGEEELLCPMCSELYDDEAHIPLMLPRCGHNFCQLCLTGCGKKGHFPCPTCRKRHLKPPVDQLQPNVDLLTQVELLKESTLGRCPSHGNLREFWCRQCNESLCGACTISKGHDVLKTRVFLSEKKNEVREQGNAILQNVVEEKEKIISKVKNCSLQLLKTCQLSSVTTYSGEDVKAVMNETKKTADIRSAMGSLKRMKSILENFRSSASEDNDLEPEEKPQGWREKHPVRALRDECHPSKHKRSRSKESLKQRDKTERENALNSGKGANPLRQRAVSNPPVAETNNKETNLDGSPLIGLLDSNLWPLRCCVYSDDGRRADLKWEEGRLHLYGLSKEGNDAHFMIKMSVLQTLIPQDNPEVFIDTTAGDKYLGRIYIRLWGHLRRAHNFLAMCMGTHGVSYRGARFREVFARGIPGECLHAGEYPVKRGGESSAGVLKDLEWEGKYRKPMMKGLVVGAGSGRPDRDSCFDICTKSNSARLFACPFGEVVGGWDVVIAIINHRPVRQVFMTNVGVVIPDHTKSSN